MQGGGEAVGVVGVLGHVDTEDEVVVGDRDLGVVAGPTRRRHRGSSTGSRGRSRSPWDRCHRGLGLAGAPGTFRAARPRRSRVPVAASSSAPASICAARRNRRSSVRATDASATDAVELGEERPSPVILARYQAIGSAQPEPARAAPRPPRAGPSGRRSGPVALVGPGVFGVLGVELGERLLDVRGPTTAVGEPGREVSSPRASSAASTRAASATISWAIRWASCRTAAPERFAPREAFAAILVPSIDTIPTFTIPAAAHSRSTCANTSANVLVPGPEPGDRGVVRGVLATHHQERDMVPTQPLDPPRGRSPTA